MASTCGNVADIGTGHRRPMMMILLWLWVAAALAIAVPLVLIALVAMAARPLRRPATVHRRP